MPYDQVGVIPYRERDDDVEVLLITSRTRGRWIVPKGNIEAELGPKGSARLEALEEAGVEGTLEGPPLGIYQHGPSPPRDVQVYLMAVEQEHPAWPEDDERTRQWVDLPAARRTVDEDGLVDLLSVAARRLRRAA